VFSNRQFGLVIIGRQNLVFNPHFHLHDVFELDNLVPPVGRRKSRRQHLPGDYPSNRIGKVTMSSCPLIRSVPGAIVPPANNSDHTAHNLTAAPLRGFMLRTSWFD